MNPFLPESFSRERIFLVVVTGITIDLLETALSKMSIRRMTGLVLGDKWYHFLPKLIVYSELL
ncbi:hypothetical protein CI677_16945 [Klebsiella pneumoniae]|jgi:hypothetical protein|nr:hypothetical protein [Klebsiella pneumoniae]MBX4503767.1 hypothetical protein [Klebsiella pneumoniae]MBX4552340.1 hypothetical protein [Klebsiella pneumoniae]MBX4616215.1 hypothetical protein [Klebsiella pneumoniae]MBX4684524.1 hypothetical protein [Klebsiella pneumoniae]